MLLDKKVAQKIIHLESLFEESNQPKDIHDLLAAMAEITDGMFEISDDAAELLSNYKGPVLNLSGLKELSQSAAAAIGGYSGDLILNGLEDLSPNILEEFSERSWKTTQYLGLNGLRNLSEDQAVALKSFQGKLGLCGITEVSDKCAKILGDCSAFHLYIDGLEAVSAITLKNLLRKRHTLSLDGLETLPNVTEEWDGNLGNIEELYLNNLIRTTYHTLIKVAEAASSNLYLGSLKSLPQTEDLFVNCSARIHFGSLKKISIMDVSNISFNGEIFLEGLEEIDVDCARLLANSSRGGTLCIGLRSMSDEVA